MNPMSRRRVARRRLVAEWAARDLDAQGQATSIGADRYDKSRKAALIERGRVAGESPVHRLRPVPHRDQTGAKSWRRHGKSRQHQHINSVEQM